MYMSYGFLSINYYNVHVTENIPQQCLSVNSSTRHCTFHDLQVITKQKQSKVS